MSQRRRTNSDDDLLPEYDFTGAVRGKYYKCYREGTNVVLLDPDVAAVFRDSVAVNDAKVQRAGAETREQQRSNKTHRTRQKTARR